MFHVIPHSLSDAEAARFVDYAFTHYRERFPQYRPELFWVGPTCACITFRIAGARLQGSVTLVEGEFHLELDVPLLLRPFRARAVRAVDDAVRDLLSGAA